MAIVITCQCGASFRAKDDLAGKQVKCPKCQAAITVPGQHPGTPQGQLSLDDLMRLASTPSPSPPSGAPASRPPAPGPVASTHGGYDRSGGYGSVEPGPSSGMSALVIGLTIVASLLVLTAGVVAVVWIMRATPPAPADAQVAQSQPAAAEAPSPPPQMERVKATMDTVGTKGKDYGEGPLATPLSLRWRIPDKVVLLYVQHALELYNGLEGHYPATHEEFMEKVVKANMLKLPDLPPGQRYIYDPETHELMVERVAQGAAKTPSGTP